MWHLCAHQAGCFRCNHAGEDLNWSPPNWLLWSLLYGEKENHTLLFLASMSFFTGQHDRHGIGFIEQRHGAGLWDQARWQADRRRRSLYTGVIQSWGLVSQIFFLIWLESGSIALHILFWAEETKNMQHVTERWIFFSFPQNMQFSNSRFNISFVHL